MNKEVLKLLSEHDIHPYCLEILTRGQQIYDQVDKINLSETEERKLSGSIKKIPLPKSTDDDDDLIAFEKSLVRKLLWKAKRKLKI